MLGEVWVVLQVGINMPVCYYKKNRLGRQTQFWLQMQILLTLEEAIIVLVEILLSQWLEKNDNAQKYMQTALQNVCLQDNNRQHVCLILWLSWAISDPSFISLCKKKKNSFQRKDTEEDK